MVNGVDSIAGGSAISLELYRSAMGVFLAVPPGCGLGRAKTLVVVGDPDHECEAFAFDGDTLVNVRFPVLKPDFVRGLMGATHAVVGEFGVRGVHDAYWLGLDFRFERAEAVA